MTNKHSRLKALEKLAAIAKVKARNKSDSAESDRLAKEVSELTNEELNARYDNTMEEIRNAPPNPDLEGLTTEQLISKYAQICKSAKEN